MILQFVASSITPFPETGSDRAVLGTDGAVRCLAVPSPLGYEEKREPDPFLASKTHPQFVCS